MAAAIIRRMSSARFPARRARTSDLRALKKRFDSALTAYEGLCESSERAVVRWLWTASPRYNLDPFWYFDPQMPFGAVLAARPRDTRGRAAYGFSAKNELVIERWYLSDLRGQYYEIFFVSMKDRIVSYHHDHQPSCDPINCSQLIFAGTRVVCFQLWAVKGWKVSGIGRRRAKPSPGPKSSRRGMSRVKDSRESCVTSKTGG